MKKTCFTLLTAICFCLTAHSQSSIPNGSFENWAGQSNASAHNPITTEPLSLPGWNSHGNATTKGVSITSDAVDGNHAAELISYPGKQDGHAISSFAQLCTGFWNCPGGGGQCALEGGYPFTHTMDTLAFYYKYMPSGNDSAQVNITFKRNGAQVWGTGINLGASKEYKYIEIPFNTGTSPDTVVVQFQSSLWQNTALSFIGSDLKIDKVAFKSQALTGVKQLTKPITIFPNPSTDGIFTIEGVNADDLIRVFNIFGDLQKIAIANQATISRVNLQAEADGLYFVRLQHAGEEITQKIIVKR